LRAHAPDSGAIDSVAAPALVGTPRQVACVRLRDVIAAHPVDLLKLDVEGAERDLLFDCADVLPQVGTMAIEVHEYDPVARRLPDILELLSGAGFTWSLDEPVPVPWLGTAAPSPFSAAASAFVLLVRAWRSECRHA
jgi:hypothetical protein